MGEFLSYSIVSGLLMLVLYLSYRLFLARDNQHAFNRGVLLAIYAVSFLAVPVVSFLNGLGEHPASQVLAMAVEGGTPAAARPVMWGTVLIWIFIAGVIVVAFRTVVTWIRLVAVIRSGRKVEKDGYTLVVTDNDRFAPFSWMRYVVISESDYHDNWNAIATHELKHISSRHWLDLLVAQAVCIVNWFNPAAWLMRDELMLVHEYQADVAVIEHGNDPQEYQMLLIKKAVGARFPSLANSLNHSKLKKRITMMYKEKSCAGRKFKALALVPMFALALGVTSVPAVRAAVSVISSSDVTVGKVSENPTKGQVVRVYKVSNIVADDGRTVVVIKGDNLGSSITVSGATFTNDGKKYQANTLNCNMTDGNATIAAVFPFSGKLKKPKMTLMVNGEEVPFNLEDFGKDDGSVRVVGYGTAKKSDADSSTLITIKSDAPSVGVTFYLDGKKIDQAEVNKISPDNIEKIEVHRNPDTVEITTKK